MSTAERNGTSLRTTPRWVKIQGVIVVLFILAMLTMSSGLITRHGNFASMHGQPQQTSGQ